MCLNLKKSSSMSDCLQTISKYLAAGHKPTPTNTTNTGFFNTFINNYNVNTMLKQCFFKLNIVNKYINT